MTNWPQPCLVIPARRASSVTLMPSGGTAGHHADVGHPEVAQGAVVELRADPPEQAGHQLGEYVVTRGHS